MSHLPCRPSRRLGIKCFFQKSLKPSPVSQSQESCFACVISDLPCPTLGLNLRSSPDGPGMVSEGTQPAWREGRLRIATEQAWGLIPECPKGVISVAAQGVV